mgnify:CR=1 FL=1
MLAKLITTLEIENFKSIEKLTIPCRRINIFIGEPNTGKSNILEAIGLLSAGNSNTLKGFIRLETLLDLFHKRDASKRVIIKTNQISCTLKMVNGTFRVLYQRGSSFLTFSCSVHGDEMLLISGNLEATCQNILSRFKFYRFNASATHWERIPPPLIPPDGRNLAFVIRSIPKLRKFVGKLFGQFGFRFVISAESDRIFIHEPLEEGIDISYPYLVVSETLRRTIFHIAAIYSNKNSVLAFEEPEAHAFPFHVKRLAEFIAFDKNGNQYFISTHNPYFVETILEKSEVKDVQVFITYLRNGKTKLKTLSESEKEELLDMGPSLFLNLELFVEEK